MGTLDHPEALPGGAGQGQPHAKGLGLGETGYSGLVALLAPWSPALAAASHRDAGSPAMLAPSPLLLCRGQAGTWERCCCPDHAPVGEVTKPRRSRGTGPGLPLPRQIPRWYRAALFLTAPPASSPSLAHPSRSGRCKKIPFNRSFSGLSAGVVANGPPSKPACWPPQCQERCHQAVFGLGEQGRDIPCTPNVPCLLPEKHSANPSGNLLYGLGAKCNAMAV